jgi:hypothetical protein
VLVDGSVEEGESLILVATRSLCRLIPLTRASLLDQLRQTKIKNLRMTVTADHDVVGLEIAMKNSGSMSFEEAVC